MASIIRQTTVVRDGWHNGFTDLQHWQDCYWVSYRKGTAHASMDGTAVVAVSVDRQRFREVAKVKVYGDNRDPKLFAMRPDRIAMTIPSWEGAYKGQALQQFITFSPDGFNWETPQPILEKGHWLWRIREHQGTWYGLVQTLRDEPGQRRIRHGLELMTSEDLLSWTFLCQVGPTDLQLNESDIVWHDDGSAWIVARSVGTPGYSYLLHSPAAPYTSWEPRELTALIHAPIILEHEGRHYVSGRNRLSLEGVDGFPSTSSLGIWELTAEGVEPVLRIPAMGDCSYPGLIKDPAGRICLSYYSQHAYAMGVVEPVHAPEENASCADVYFAELDLQP